MMPHVFHFAGQKPMTDYLISITLISRPRHRRIGELS